jgi:hypothetical protein
MEKAISGYVRFASMDLNEKEFSKKQWKKQDILRKEALKNVGNCWVGRN